VNGARLMIDCGDGERIALEEAEGIAHASYEVGQICLARAIEKRDPEDFQRARNALTESYGIVLNIGRLAGICLIGWALGPVFAMAGQPDEARQVLQRSLDGFRKLGRMQEAAQVEGLLQQLR
jgi:hypothetical protein